MPTNVPKAGFSDCFRLFFWIYSPEIAPKNDPKIKPKGPPTTSPIKSPKVAPIKPFLVPPSFFKPKTGNIKSIKKIKAAIRNVIIKNFELKGIKSEKWIIKSPNQLVIGPGIIGVKLPIKPIKQKINPIIIKNISIKIFYKIIFNFRIK